MPLQGRNIAVNSRFEPTTMRLLAPQNGAPPTRPRCRSCIAKLRSDMTPMIERNNEKTMYDRGT